ncbi:MAG: C25 family cysteine peptidase [Candidatus Contendobacter sp.]|nr:C25 family cysteine peptidase [Candidatus Contendobacter sp.]
MQDAAIDYANTSAYGANNGSGSGATNYNNAGLYEFVVATSAVSSGSVSITGKGSGGGLLNTYTNAAATTTLGQRRFQVVRVPQYYDATISGTVTASAWNGASGGIVVLDVVNTLTFSGGGINVDAQGFRGGLGQKLTAGSSSLTAGDYRSLATLNANGNKGEGVAGSPDYMYNGSTSVDNSASGGYPNGSSAHASRARGAPGNAGGGGSDGNPTNSTNTTTIPYHPYINAENSGGGGGGNGGTGGTGGNTWLNDQPFGGIGGGAISPHAASRLAMGGGGGSGSRNNGSNMDSSGGLGGGIIIVRANSITGTGTLSANGGNGVTTTTIDGGGGGGAGGSVLVLTRTGNLSSLTVHANGGTGGSTSSNTDVSPYCTTSSPCYHGPGGGGGGGVVYLSSAAGTVSVTGGSAGASSGNTYNAASGTAGVSDTSLTESQIPGTASSATCKIDAVNDTPPAVPATGGTTTSVVANDTTNGGSVTLGTNATLTPGTAPTPTPTAGSITMNADGTITVAAGTTPGTYSYPYTLCTLPATTPPTCDTATATVTVSASIVPATDTGTATAGTAGTPIANVRSNDFVNGAAATAANSTIAQSGTWPPGITLDPSSGAISTTAAVTPGTYHVDYQLCDKNSPANCATVTDTITVNASIVPATDTGTATAGTAGTPIANVRSNDFVNGAAATAANSTIAQSGTWPPGITLDPSSGAISTTAAVTPGTYHVDYQLCDKNSPANCATVTDTITVNASIVPATDTGTATAGTAGTPIANVRSNDFVNGAAATAANSTIAQSGTWPPGITLDPSSGAISTTAAVTPGTYHVDYQLCDKNSPANCATVTDTITVNSGTTQALIGSFRAYTSANGQTMVEWETVSEVNTVGFNLFREDPVSGKFFQVNTRLLPGLFTAPQGGVYHYPDLTVASAGTYTYRLQEVEANGTLRDYGPFTVTVTASTNQQQAMRAIQAQTLAAETLADADGYERAAHALNGRTVTSSAAQTMAASQTSTPNTAIRILVKQDGLYTVSADQIAAALAVTSQTAQSWINTGMVRLQQGGQPVAWQADSSGARLYFYGQAIQGVDSVYTPYNVYWLDHSSGVTMNVLSGKGPAPTTSALPFQSSIHVEQNLKPVPSLLTDPDADFWFWNYARAGDATLSAPQFAVPVPNPATTGTVTLRAALQGATDLVPGNDHHARVLVNGNQVGDATWDGIAPYVLTATFDAALLAANGNNTITVSGILDQGVSSSLFWVNGFDVDYPRTYQATSNQLRLRGAGNPVATVSGFSSANIAVLDLSNPRQPQWVAATTVTSAGTGYAVSFAPATPSTDYVAAVAVAPVSVTGVVASTLKTQTSGADYLVLTPTALRTGADALAAYRGGKVVELQDIYDAFNDGIANPHAIRDFLSYAYDQWQPQPHYVALVGKGTYDPKDYKGLHTNLFPVLMVPTSKGLIAADNPYADVHNDDGITELAMGRIPALTNADVQNYVAKLQAYESGSALAKALLVADDPDVGGNFTADSQAVADVLQQNHGFTTTPIYFQTGGAAATTRQQIISALNAGVGLFNYVGHGGNQQLAAEGLLRNADAGQLTNGTRLPVFLAFTCYIGNGSYPGQDSLTEALLWRQGGGIVAAFASTGPSDDGQAHTLNLSLIDTLFGTTPVLGDAAAAALTDLARKGGTRSMLDIYQVFGDPALRTHQ